MNRFLAIFNFLGICFLIVLIALQWSANRREHQQITALQSTNQIQSAQIADQSRTIRGQLADLDDFRHRLEQANSDLSQTQQKLAAMTAQRDRLKTQNITLIAEAAHLQVILKQWAAAVSARDALIQKASAEIESLGQQRNDAILRFNALVAKYNALAKQFQSTNAGH